ncbi:twin-arginine translocase subunit TatC [Metallumcola ferriviriculae]|uniref:Sec-independent protein translocase protein TatC n=1 Tax=Metallumcola ferriviriculae TaxID=3039180 RepID=A0AAU0UR15_9FIRM|nr:twin-arginine translocase subunit TatC [Desulfitibacteraceae bacterium MK1]
MSSDIKTISRHLDDLRRDLVVAFGAVTLAALSSYLFLQEQMTLIWFAPIRNLDIALAYIVVTEAFLTKIRLSFLTGTILAFPVIAWRVVGFIFPALTVREKRYALVVVPVASILFAGGVFFAYFAVLPFAMKFFLLEAAGEYLKPMISVSKYVSFLTSFLLPFGLVFQLPLTVICLTRLGLVDYKFLAAKRKYALLITFGAAALITPPDVISQILLAVPIFILYEVGIWLSLLVMVRDKRKKSGVSAE